MQIISRQDAKAAGLKRYFNGVKCGRGHWSERLVSDCSCLQCNREKNAARLESKRDLINASRREKRASNPEKHREKDRAYKAERRDEINAKQRANYTANLEKSREYQRAYYKANIEKKRSYARAVQSARYAKNSAPFKAAARKHRAERKRAVPSWFGEFDAFVWEEASSLADIRRMVTGIKWHADHMIPIQADEAFGLHTWNNCQVIPAVLNNSKNNRMMFVNPSEWIGAL